MEWLCDIKWKDNGEVSEGVIISDQTPEEESEEDNRIFFHIKDEEKLKDLACPGNGEDFLVLSYKLLAELEFETVVMGEPYKPTEEELRNQEIVEDYFYRVDTYDKYLDKAGHMHPDERLRMSRRFAHNTLALTAHYNSMEVSDMKELITEYNKRRNNGNRDIDNG